MHLARCCRLSARVLASHPRDGAAGRRALGVIPRSASFHASRESPACAVRARCSNKEKALKLLSLFPIHDSKRLVENGFRNNPLVPPTHIAERFLQQMHRKSPTSARAATIPRISSVGYSLIIWKLRCFYFPYRTGGNFFFLKESFNHPGKYFVDKSPAENLPTVKKEKKNFTILIPENTVTPFWK